MRISDWSSDVCSSDLAVTNSRSQPLISATLGHSLIATEDPANYPQSERVLKTAVALDNQNPFAWYPLGIVYANKGDQARDALPSAERYLHVGGKAGLAPRNVEIDMQRLRIV